MKPMASLGGNSIKDTSVRGLSGVDVLLFGAKYAVTATKPWLMYLLARTLAKFSWNELDQTWSSEMISFLGKGLNKFC